MAQCPITYESCSPAKYSLQGLKRLNKGLSTLEPFDLSHLPTTTVSSIDPSVWPFTCTYGRINTKEQRMESVDKQGKFLLFPPSRQYAQIPQNLDLSLRLAQRFGLPVPFHGLIHDQDGTLTCFVDASTPKAIPVNSTSATPQLNQQIEDIAASIDALCTFPVLEKYKFLQRLIFSWLIGFETQHTSCFTFHLVAQKIELAPANLFFNSILPLGSSNKEMGLSIDGKYTGITGSDFIDYTGKKVLGLTTESIHYLTNSFHKTYLPCREIVLNSFLSEELKEQYLDILVGRLSRLRG